MFAFGQRRFPIAMSSRECRRHDLPADSFIAGYCDGKEKACMSKRLQSKYRIGSVVPLPTDWMLWLK